MVIDGLIRGKNIYLQSVMADDAKFIVKIRNDSQKNRYVHAVDNDVEKEIAWIDKQHIQPNDYYFSVKHWKDKIIIGTVSIYNVDLQMREAELGRWVSYGTASDNLETILLAHNFAFETLNLCRVYTKTLSENKKVVNFWKRFGGQGVENHVDEGVSFYKNTITANEYSRIMYPRWESYVKGINI